MSLFYIFFYQSNDLVLNLEELKPQFKNKKGGPYNDFSKF